MTKQDRFQVRPELRGNYNLVVYTDREGKRQREYLQTGTDTNKAIRAKDDRARVLRVFDGVDMVRLCSFEEAIRLVSQRNIRLDFKLDLTDLTDEALADLIYGTKLPGR